MPKLKFGDQQAIPMDVIGVALAQSKSGMETREPIYEFKFPAGISIVEIGENPGGTGVSIILKQSEVDLLLPETPE